ncbi:MAG TPA: hypothetical protein VLE73_00010 [Candidatus Saccharimonadales bacterium]|nr:hypothetical protein [Candidatus Saccharimonadales bacterium]
MARVDTTNTADFQRFPALSLPDQLAVQMKYYGNTHIQISTALRSVYGIKKSEHTVRGWFLPGCRLEAAYMDFVDAVADTSVKKAKLLAMRFSERAIGTLGELMTPTHDANIRLEAAKALANKYIPDRQASCDGVKLEDDFPIELA